MKLLRSILFYFVFLFHFSSAQNGLSVNGNNASLFVRAGSFLSVTGDFNNVKCDQTQIVRFEGSLFLTGNLNNNDQLKFFPASAAKAKECRIIFNANTGTQLTGTVAPEFWEFELNQGLGNSMQLYNDVFCLDTLNFKSGFLILHNRKWILKDPNGAPSIMNHPWIKGERNGSAFISVSISDTAKIIYNTVYTNSVNLEAGNIGVRITGLVNIGSPVSIVRSANNQVNCGKGGIAKHFAIRSPGHKLVNNGLQFKYCLNDLANYPYNYLSPLNLKVYVSPNTDQDWTPLPSSTVVAPASTNSNNGIANIVLSDLRNPNMLADSNSFRITLADPDCLNPPVSLLGPDTLHICTGDSLTLDLGNSTNLANTQLRYEWFTSPGLYTRTLQVQATALFQKYKAQLMDARGCTTIDSIVIAPAAPFPVIKYLNHLNACIGDSITIKDTVTIASGTFTNSYSFSNISTRFTNANSFKNLFPNAGRYAMQLSSTSNHGCTSMATQTNLLVYNLPTAAFSHSLNCTNRLSQFTDQSSSNDSLVPVTLHKWTFNAVNTSSVTNPSLTFSVSGTYSVKEVITTAFGCRDSISQNIIIYQDNIAAFIKNNVCFGDTVLFNSTSTCNTGSCSLLWNFGDNTNDTLPSVKKVFSSAGLYLTSLKINAPVGCPDSISIPVFVNPNPSASILSNTIANCPNEIFYLMNNSNISSGNIINSTWQTNAQSPFNSWNAALQYSAQGIYTVNLTVASDSLCYGNAALSLSVHPAPQALLVSNSTCFGNISSFSTPFQNPAWSYSFDPGAASSVQVSTSNNFQYLYAQAGSYTATLLVENNFGCTDTSSTIHQVLAAPYPPFSGSLSTCGDAYVLNALNAGSSFFWNSLNSITPTITCTSSGWYQVTITNTNVCSLSSQVYLQLNSAVSPFLGNDTTVCGNIKLDASYPGATYFWSTGQSSQVINVQSSGTIGVLVTDQNGCQGADTISVLVKTKPTINLGADQNICNPPLGVILQASVSSGTCLWNNGVAGISNTITSSGNYWASVSATNGCTNADTIFINLRSKPNVNLGPDQTICDKIILDAQNFGLDYVWSNGSTTQTTNITNSGQIWVEVQNTQSGCSTADTISIMVFKSPELNLGADTSVCENKLFILRSGIPSVTYLWMNGSTANTFTVTKPGLIGLTLTGSGGCTASDYRYISFITAPNIQLGPATRYLCGNQSFSLSTNTVAQTAWTKNNQTIGTNSVITIDEQGLYKVRVTNNGCFDSDSVLVIATNNTIHAEFLASTVDTINRSVKFVNLSQPNPLFNSWSFGDGLYSQLENPEHVWVLPQDFIVTLEVSNGYCSDVTTKSLSLLFKENLEQLEEHPALEFTSIRLFPNPATSYVDFYAELNHNADLAITMVDPFGKILHQSSYSNTKFQNERIPVFDLANGMYLFNISATGPRGLINYQKKIIIYK